MSTLNQVTDEQTKDNQGYELRDYYSKILKGLPYAFLLFCMYETAHYLHLLEVPIYVAIFFSAGLEGSGLAAKDGLDRYYITKTQQHIGYFVLFMAYLMGSIATVMTVFFESVPYGILMALSIVFIVATFILVPAVSVAYLLSPERLQKLQERENEHKANELKNVKQGELSQIRLQTHYDNLIADEEQKATIAQTDNNIVSNTLAIKLAESEIQLAQSQRMKADALKLIESKGEKGNKVKEKSLTAIYAQIEEHTKSDEGKREMAEMAKLFFKATIEDVGNTLLPSSIDVAPPTLQAINTSSTAQQVPAIINNRLPNSPRKCENPSCGKPIPASSHKSKKYCGNSCKTQASKARNTP